MLLHVDFNLLIGSGRMPYSEMQVSGIMGYARLGCLCVKANWPFPVKFVKLNYFEA